MQTFVIVNPLSRGGKTARHADVIVRDLRSALGDVSVVLTTGCGDATTRTREALRAGYRRIVAVGGDGTTNEVVNGFFADGALINPHATLGDCPQWDRRRFPSHAGLAIQL